ncbi:hypothetical protein GCM10010299_23160 [Streptomyces tanashiensis]|uniref:hypothetical protein n=1 Tax=Streptomyces tanashiensis TaxID=67367 RepID=UPI00167CB5D2|nr:hypothetical protein GCM10010299_23160 [Streptomyces tanashiensis]
MWESLSAVVLVAIVAEPLLRRTRNRWRRRRVSQTVGALSRGQSVRIRCAARFRHSGGGRQRAHLTVRAEGAFISTVGGTLSKVRLGAPGTTLEIIAEQSMIVCDVAGRQLEVLLPTGEERLIQAVAARLSDGATNPPQSGTGARQIASD